MNTAADYGQLVPMLEQAEELMGERPQVTLADGGYHTAANLEAGKRRGQLLVMAERYQEMEHNITPTSRTGLYTMPQQIVTSLPSGPATHLPQLPQVQAIWFRAHSSLLHLKNSMSDLPGLRSLHQRQTRGASALDWVFRRVITQA